LRILQSVPNLVCGSLKTECQFLRRAEPDRRVDAKRPILDVVELARRALPPTDVRTAVGECVVGRARQSRRRLDSFIPVVIPVGARAKISVVANVRDLETAVKRYAAAGKPLEKCRRYLQIARIVDAVVALIEAERELIAAARPRVETNIQIVEIRLWL
jgi:hypothetical protein